jgi:hypothetical protein
MVIGCVGVHSWAQAGGSGGGQQAEGGLAAGHAGGIVVRHLVSLGHGRVCARVSGRPAPASNT